ncbi:MAG: hypothetical protein AB7O73_06685 [Bacteroidia bacterium]
MKITLNIFIILGSKLFFGQVNDNYIKYYNLCNSGDKELYYKNYQAALNYYDSAFKCVKYSHSFNLEKAAIAATKANNKDKATQYLRQAILNGKSAEILKDKKYRKLKHFDKFVDLKDSAKIHESNFRKRINTKYAREIDSLQFIDQYVIRGNKFFKNHFYFNPDTISNKSNLDSIVFSHLLSLIEKYGFPSERVVGPKGYENVYIILHHNVRLPQNSKYIEMVTNALHNGEYLPENFAWMYDQSKEFKNEKPFFYYGSANPTKLSQSERQEIEKNRFEYGVKPIESTRIKVIGKVLIQRQLW